MKIKYFIILFLAFSATLHSQDPYKLVWNSPGNSSKSSMPLGNGDIGLNVWTEEPGNICFYISKTDAWEDNGRLLKIGKVKINVTPNPFKNGTPFLQTLNVLDGTIEIKAGKGRDASTFLLWVDANNPVIHIDASLPENSVMTSSSEIWRTATDTVKKLEISDLNYFPQIYGLTIVRPDVVMNVPGKVAWYHSNEESTGFRYNLLMQGLYDFGLEDPLKDRIFGAEMAGTGFTSQDEHTLVSKSGKERELTICVNTLHPATPQQWLVSVEKSGNDSRNADKKLLLLKHKEWWHSFWNRSWVKIASSDTITTRLGVENQGNVLTKGYVLQRFVSACAGRGAYPIKFNGSIFTVDYDGTEGFGDYRRWGTGYWWQNTRLAYLSMPASGDFEMMMPLFKMYFDQLPFAKYRTKVAYNHDGAFFPECVYFWGPVFTECWGLKHIDLKSERIQESNWHKHEWVCGLELATMMYDYYLYTNDKEFARNIFLPFAEQVMLFFARHYKTDNTGLLRFEPSQALETWWTCTNAIPEVAGMHYLVDRMKTLPEGILSSDFKKLISETEPLLPKIPTRQFEGKRMLAPAESFDVRANIETPELYAVFPFRLYGIGKPDIDLAINAYESRGLKTNEGWPQDDIFAALMGLTGEAKAGVLKRASTWDKSQRFPAFWGPNYDWTPDQCHGGVLQKAIQAMLLQCDEKKIRLLPAWPKEWDVDFKLMAPGNTTVELSYTKGKITRLHVTPEDRIKDVIFP